MTMPLILPNRVEVLTSVQRLRRWTKRSKLEIAKKHAKKALFLL